MNKINIRNINWKLVVVEAIFAIFLGIAIQFGSAYLLDVVMSTSVGSTDAAQDYNEIYEGLTSMTPLMIIYVSILAPLVEELIFRLGIIGLGRKIAPFWIVNVIQAIAFGIYHGDIIQGTYAFILGLVLGIIFEYFGGYITVLITHSSINISGLCLVKFFPIVPSVLGRVVIGLVSFLVIGIAIIVMHRFISRLSVD